MAGSAVKRGYASGALANHYSLLRTIEAAWGMPTLTGNHAGAIARSVMFTTGSPPPSPSPSPTATPTPTPRRRRPNQHRRSKSINGAPCTVTLPDGHGAHRHLLRYLPASCSRRQVGGFSLEPAHLPLNRIDLRPPPVAGRVPDRCFANFFAHRWHQAGVVIRLPEPACQ
jgi:hypothetical protein